MALKAVLILTGLWITNKLYIKNLVEISPKKGQVTVLCYAEVFLSKWIKSLNLSKFCLDNANVKGQVGFAVLVCTYRA